LALRAGIIALLRSSIINKYLGELEIVDEYAHHEDFYNEHPDIDLLIIAEAWLSRYELHQIEASNEDSYAILVLSDDPKVPGILSEITKNAWGVLPLETSAEELQAAVGALMEGLLVAAPESLDEILRNRLSIFPTESKGDNQALTEREGQVLEQLARGLSNKQIANALTISEHTVKFHISSIYTKLGVKNRAEAVRVGIQRGAISI
jgi:DNA-binding NarL/FixJ family response regulator